MLRFILPDTAMIVKKITPAIQVVTIALMINFICAPFYMTGTWITTVVFRLPESTAFTVKEYFPADENVIVPDA